MNDSESSERLKQKCFQKISADLSADQIPHFIRKIGSFDLDYDNTRQCSLFEQLYKVMEKWVMRCGLFTNEMKAFLEGVVQEVISSRRDPALDNWLAGKSEFLQRNREIAWLLYSVIFHHYIDDLWRSKVREQLKMQPHELAQVEHNYSRDIIEQKYRILRLWMQQARLTTAHDTRHKLESIGVHVPEDTVQFSSSVQEGQEDDVANAQPNIL